MTRTVPKVQRDESRTQGLHRLELFRLLLPGRGIKSRNLPITARGFATWRPVADSGPAGPLILRPMTGRPIDRRGAYRRVTRIARLAASTAHQPPLAAVRRDRPDYAALRVDAAAA